MSKKQRNYSPEFKAKIALAAIKSDQSLAEIAQRYNLAHNQISTWKKQLHPYGQRLYLSYGYYGLVFT